MKRNIAPSLLGTTGKGATALAGLQLFSSLIPGLVDGQNMNDIKDSMLGQLVEQKISNDKTTLNPTKIKGVTPIQYYGKGGRLLPSSSKGKFNTTGGDLIPLNSDAELAVGNTHGEKTIDNSYGITLDNGQEPVAEIEDQEVLVDNEKVFSDRLMYSKNKTFADVSKALQIKAGKFENKLDKNTNTATRNTIERQLAGIKMATEKLFQEQESVKEKEGEEVLNNVVPKAAKGMLIPSYKQPSSSIFDDPSFSTKKGTGLAIAGALADNVGNAIITANTPRLPKPLLTPALQLETEYNINPQLAAVTDAVTDASDNILRNTSNSNVARSNVANIKTKGLQKKLELLGDKENRELDLRNKLKEYNHKIDMTNLDSLNKNNLNNYQRKLDIGSMISGNVANLSEDTMAIAKEIQNNNKEEEKLFLDYLNDNTGQKAKDLEKLYFLNPRFRRKVRMLNLTKN